MEITLDTLTQHDTDEPVDLQGEDAYGWLSVPRQAVDKTMEAFGLERIAHFGRSSVIWWRGEVGQLHIEVRATRMIRVMGGWRYVQDSYNETYTHYRMKAYMPENVHIVGTGRDRYAWSIYRTIVRLIEEERAKDA